MKNVSTFVIAFLVFGFLFLTLPEEGIAGLDFSLGCCRTVDLPPTTPGGDCIGCDDTSGCSLNVNGCTGFFNTSQVSAQVCTTDVNNDAVCIPFDPAGLGCCEFAPGDCSETQITFAECNDQNSVAWFPSDDCSAVPQCGDTPPTAPPSAKNVPTLSGWGFISLVVVLALVGLGVLLARRKKASA